MQPDPVSTPKPARKPRQWQPVVRRWVIGIISIYLGIIVVLMFLESSFIYHPVKAAAGWKEPNDPAVKDVWLKSEVGDSIHAWWCPTPGAKWVVLYCHGNAGNLSHRLDVIRQCWHRRVKASVLIFDYPGYGRCTGRPTEAGCYAAGHAAYDWLIKEQKVPPNELVLFGSSLGGAVALELAVAKPHRALVLLSPFTSVPDMAQELFPFLPARWFVRTKFDNVGKIAKYEGSLFHAHGTADLIVPFAHSDRLFAAATAAKFKRFMKMPDVGHHDGAGFEFYDKVAEFLAESPSRSTAP